MTNEQTKPRSAYQIMISEEQRAILAKTLRDCKFAAALFLDKEEHEELVTMLEMLEDLPSNDAECPPNTLHGFCL